VLAVSPGCFVAAPIATCGAATGHPSSDQTLAFVEVGVDHAGRDRLDAVGAVERADALPATLSGPFTDG
jgi:hypothetical protein